MKKRSIPLLLALCPLLQLVPAATGTVGAAAGTVGGTDGKLDPRSNATRAQVAAILMRAPTLK